MKLYLATNNPHKVKELLAMLRTEALPIEALSAVAVGGMPPVEETEETFEGNARLKAQALKAIVPEDAWVLADDSGLVVDALHGRPGVTSARYAGEEATAAENNDKLLRELAVVAEEERQARFVCCLVLLGPQGFEKTFHGRCEGTIARALSGDQGFGYDPLFRPQGHEQTFGELGVAVKNKISHRALALMSLVQELKAYNPEL